jgi:hypothetical protein
MEPKMKGIKWFQKKEVIFSWQHLVGPLFPRPLYELVLWSLWPKVPKVETFYKLGLVCMWWKKLVDISTVWWARQRKLKEGSCWCYKQQLNNFTKEEKHNMECWSPH